MTSSQEKNVRESVDVPKIWRTHQPLHPHPCSRAALICARVQPRVAVPEPGALDHDACVVPSARFPRSPRPLDRRRAALLQAHAHVFDDIEGHERHRLRHHPCSRMRPRRRYAVQALWRRRPCGRRSSAVPGSRWRPRLCRRDAVRLLRRRCPRVQCNDLTLRSAAKNSHSSVVELLCESAFGMSPALPGQSVQRFLSGNGLMPASGRLASQLLPIVAGTAHRLQRCRLPVG